VEYDTLKKSELFSFFHFTEIGRRPYNRGLMEICFKPGGFQEFIDMSIGVDRQSGVHEGVLLLDRDWIGGPMTVNPFGKDLAKSFVEAITHPEDKEKACSVITTIWNLSGRKDEVNYLHDKQEIAEEQIAQLTNVYLGTERCYSIELDKCRILIENITDVGRPRLKISITSLEE